MLGFLFGASQEEKARVSRRCSVRASAVKVCLQANSAAACDNFAQDLDLCKVRGSGRGRMTLSGKYYSYNIIASLTWQRASLCLETERCRLSLVFTLSSLARLALSVASRYTQSRGSF